MADGDARRDVDAAVAAWANAGSRLDEASRRAVVAAVVHALDGGRSGSWIEALYRFDPTLSITVDDARSLRVVLYDRLVTPRDPAEAVDLQHRLGLLIDELVAAAAERRLRLLEQTAMVDPLTGLLNRRGFDAAFASTLAQARRHGRAVALAMVDLDGLKRINDTSGHAAGDETLRAFANAITRGLRAGDNAFRIGGDEFVVLAPDTNADDLSHVMRRIAEDAPAFSAGIAEMPADGDDAATILSVADARLYGTRRIEAESRRPHLLSRMNVALLALAFAAVAAVLAEGVRRAVGVDATGTTAAAWQLILATGPVACAVVAGTRGRASAIDALRRGSALAGVSLLAMIATMTPLFVRTAAPEGTRQWLAGGPLTPPTTAGPSSRPSASPTGTTTTTTTLPEAVDAGSDDVPVTPRTRPVVQLDPDLVAAPPVVRPATTPPATTPPTSAPTPPTASGNPPPTDFPISVPRPPVTTPVPEPTVNGGSNGGDTCATTTSARVIANNGNGRDGQEVRCEPTPRRRDPIPGNGERAGGRRHD